MSSWVWVWFESGVCLNCCRLVCVGLRGMCWFGGWIVLLSVSVGWCVLLMMWLMCCCRLNLRMCWVVFV